MFTASQIEELLNIVDYHYLFTISTNFGKSYLTKSDEKLLTKFGFNLKDLSKGVSGYDKMYLLGKLTASLRDDQVNSLDFGNYLKYIKRGQYIPLNKVEQSQLDIARRKSYVHLKGLKEKSKQQFETILLNNETLTKSAYEAVVKDEIERGVLERKSLGSIVSELGHRTENWAHDWGRIVDTEMNNIFQQGRAEVFEKEDGPDVLVYKQVYPGACRHCISKYLTNGIGSKPKVFKLSDLIANGTNIGRKVINWLATITGLHPFCRCHLNKVPKGYVWDEEKEMFNIPKDFKRKIDRKSKIIINVGDKVLEV